MIRLTACNVGEGRESLRDGYSKGSLTSSERGRSRDVAPSPCGVLAATGVGQEELLVGVCGRGAVGAGGGGVHDLSCSPGPNTWLWCVMRNSTSKAW